MFNFIIIYISYILLINHQRFSWPDPHPVRSHKLYHRNNQMVIVNNNIRPLSKPDWYWYISIFFRAWSRPLQELSFTYIQNFLTITFSVFSHSQTFLIHSSFSVPQSLRNIPIFHTVKGKLGLSFLKCWQLFWYSPHLFWLKWVKQNLLPLSLSL